LLFDDNRFVRQPGFTADAVGPATHDPESPFRAELFDAEERLLLRTGIPLTEPCTDGPRPDPPFLMAEGVILLPAKARLVRFMLGDVLVEEYRIPEGEPRTEFTAVPRPGARGTTRVAWKSNHPEAAALTHVVGFSSDNGQSWQPVGLPTARTEVELDLNALPGGEQCRVCVKTTDGAHTITTVSDAFALPVKPCLAMILAPENGTRIEQGSSLHLEGQGYWLEEHRAELDSLSWSSSLAGALGRGPSLDIGGLEPGTHEITLAAGEGDRVGTASIEIVVG
jgi:hypothetical protein